jgi:hypothetical protein
MKDQARGPFERATAVAEGFAAAVRRRQRDREPSVLLYRRPGDPHVLAPGAKGHDTILALADRMVALVVEAELEAAPARWGRTRREEGDDDHPASRRRRRGGAAAEPASEEEA